MNKEKLREEEFILKGDLKAISIVTSPAIEQPFKMFETLELFKEESIKYKFKEEFEKQELTGPVMIPELRIPRRDTKTKEIYNCWFSKETVVECAETYLEHCNHTSANFEHLQDTFTNSVFVKESWIVVDPLNDKANALGFSDIVEGSWFVTYKFKSTELWEAAKELGFTGFSIEAFFESFSSIKDKELHLNKMIFNVINSNLSDKDKYQYINQLINKK